MEKFDGGGLDEYARVLGDRGKKCVVRRELRGKGGPGSRNRKMIGGKEETRSLTGIEEKKTISGGGVGLFLGGSLEGGLKAVNGRGRKNATSCEGASSGPGKKRISDRFK